jgi:hypothetical protein
MEHHSTPSLLIWLRSQWDRVAGYTCVAAGAVCLVIGAVQISRSPSILSQLSYIGSAGLVGLFLTMVGVGLLVSADLHDEWRKLDRIEAAIRRSGEPVASGAPSATGADPGWPPFCRSVPAAVVRPAPVGLGLVGVAGLVAGFTRTSRTLDIDNAIQGLAVSASGLAALGLATATIVAALRRDVSSRMVAALGGFGPPPVVADRPAWAVAAPARPDEFVFVPGLHRYHRSSCPAVAGQAAVALASREAPEGLRACGICDAASQWSKEAQQ